MSVKIRLARAGAKKHPFYRIVAADTRSPRDGRFLERLGTYDPSSEPSTVVVDRARIEYWLGHGALPTDTVRRLLAANKPTATKPA
jgi:small subunit ribosomal protein S16